jgi:hypothetical protein
MTARRQLRRNKGGSAKKGSVPKAAARSCEIIYRSGRRGRMTGKIARMPVDAYLDTHNSVPLSLSRQAYQEEVSKCKSWRRKKDSRTKFEDRSNHESLGKNLSEKRISNPDADDDHDDSSTAQVVQHLDSKDRKDLLKPRPRLLMTKLPACWRRKDTSKQAPPEKERTTSRKQKEMNQQKHKTNKQKSQATTKQSLLIWKNIKTTHQRTHRTFCRNRKKPPGRHR